jgi:DNA primase
MARIKDEDVAIVRERARIDEVVREHVALRSAGGGSLKGLCPFHDEKSPSFHVTPAKGYWHCFGCQEGGDVITFVRKIDALQFNEAVEKLAGKFGIQLRYEEGSSVPNRQQGQRQRLVEAHAAAAAFYAKQLRSPEASAGRAFLDARGFDATTADHFGVGYAPKGWDHLLNHLRGLGFSQEELLLGGLMSQGSRGVYDRFRGRLVWPIRDLGGAVIGFGARKLYDDDDGPKYLNTPETPIYKKSMALYGIDLARRDISKQQQAVIVEGYTDVMACHMAGITTAVATCGTAFGADHIKVLRRLLMDDDAFRGEVIFTFDGDAAGRKAAMRAFEDDQKFVSSTFVAVEPNGLDPCELRQQSGDIAVRQLIADRKPMFEFAIRSIISDYDLDSAEGRIAALRATAPVVARIRDHALRPEYTRLLAGWLGMEPAQVSEAVTRAPKAGRVAESAHVRRADAPPPTTVRRMVMPNSVEARVEREALKAALQHAAAVADWYDVVERDAYTVEQYRLAHDAIQACGGAGAAAEPGWFDRVLVAAPDDAIRSILTACLVEPIALDASADTTRYGTSVVARLLELDATRRIVELKSRLQRMDPDNDAYQQAFVDLLSLEQQRRELADQARGV